MDNTKPIIDLPLAEPIGHSNFLRLNIDYQLGGRNYFSGDNERRGIYCIIKPISKGENSITSVLLGGKRESGYKVLLMELTRKNAKTINACFERLKPLAEQIKNFYMADNHNEIFTLLKTTFNAN